MLKLGHPSRTAGMVANWFDEQNQKRNFVKRSKSSGSDDGMSPGSPRISSVYAKSYIPVGKVVRPQVV